MTTKIEVPAAFSPLVKLELPSPEEYHKRKVALISGAWSSFCFSSRYSNNWPAVF